MSVSIRAKQLRFQQGQQVQQVHANSKPSPESLNPIAGGPTSGVMRHKLVTLLRPSRCCVDREFCDFVKAAGRVSDSCTGDEEVIRGLEFQRRI